MAILFPLKIQEEGIETSRFRLAQVAAQRAKMLIRGAIPLVDSEYRKSITIALEEIYEGHVSYYSHEEANKIRDDLEKRAKEQEEAEVKALQDKEVSRVKAQKEPDKEP